MKWKKIGLVEDPPPGSIVGRSALIHHPCVTLLEMRGTTHCLSTVISQECDWNRGSLGFPKLSEVETHCLPTIVTFAFCTIFATEKTCLGWNRGALGFPKLSEVETHGLPTIMTSAFCRIFATEKICLGWNRGALGFPKLSEVETCGLPTIVTSAFCRIFAYREDTLKMEIDSYSCIQPSEFFTMVLDCASVAKVTQQALHPALADYRAVPDRRSKPRPLRLPSLAGLS
ncbi:hypothetical protein J6590_051382 [Homalodisca vitripennis]|nr:hypothetical protein J6590_051382 [Homalodisca vitripennis]